MLGSSIILGYEMKERKKKQFKKRKHPAKDRINKKERKE